RLRAVCRSRTRRQRRGARRQASTLGFAGFAGVCHHRGHIHWPLAGRPFGFLLLQRQRPIVALVLLRRLQVAALRQLIHAADQFGLDAVGGVLHAVQQERGLAARAALCDRLIGLVRLLPVCFFRHW